MNRTGLVVSASDDLLTLLALVRMRRKPEGPRDQLAVDLGVVGGHVGQQLVDELLMTLLSLDDCHNPIVRPAFLRPS